MDYFQAFKISASGMAAEKLRLELTAANLSNMHSSAARAQDVYRPLRLQAETVPLQFGHGFDQLFVAHGGGTRVTGVVAADAEPRMVHEPSNPYADSKGFVAYPAIDQTAEMLNLSAALRTYEANVVAMNAAKTMASRTLDIGRQG
jgi:flagellar basal-body rod protein FlgC